jgi:hypothetical protein
MARLPVAVRVEFLSTPGIGVDPPNLVPLLEFDGIVFFRLYDAAVKDKSEMIFPCLPEQGLGHRLVFVGLPDHLNHLSKTGSRWKIMLFLIEGYLHE